MKLDNKKNEIHLNNDLNSAIRALQICENEKQKYIDNKAAKESNTNVLNL